MKALLLLLLLPFQLLATDYYFNLNGSDAGAGTSVSPWKTAPKFNSLLLNPDDRVFFNGGDRFPGPFYLSRSGTFGHQIIITSYGSGQAILEGFEDLSGHFTTVTGAIAEATCNTCSAYVNMVRFYGKNQPMARTPNYNSNDGGFWTMQAGTTTAVLSPSIPFGSAYIGAEAVVHANNYTFNRSTISGQTAGQFTVNTMPDVPLVNFGTFVQNAFACIDTVGDWFWKNSTRKLQMQLDSLPTIPYSVEVAGPDTVVTFSASYVTLKNVIIEGANKYNVCFPINASYDSIINCNIRFAGVNGIEVSNSTPAILSHCVFNNTPIRRANNNGFSVVYPAQVNDSKLDLDSIEHIALIAGAGLSGGATYGGVQWYGLRDTITRLNLYKTGGPGWAQYGGDTNYFKYVHADSTGLVTSDVGGIYFSVHSGVINTFEKCISSNCIGNKNGTDQVKSIYGAGFYQDSKSTNLHIIGCTSFGCTYTGMTLHMARSSVIDSFTSVFNGTSQLYLQEDIDTAYGNRVTNSIFIAKDSPSLVVAWYLQGRNNLNTCFLGNDHNVYARPIRQTTPMRNNAGALTYYDLPGYINLIGQDYNSKGTPTGISDDSKMILFVNTTFSDSTIQIPPSYITAYGVKLPAGPYILHPFTSLVLIPLPIGFFIWK